MTDSFIRVMDYKNSNAVTFRIMPCGKRSLVKTWDKPKHIRVVKPSRYQQNEASVKVHWNNVIRELELSYKDEQFWETQCDTVRELVGPEIFGRIAKTFNLPLEATQYQPASEVSSVNSSGQYYAMPPAAADDVDGAPLRPAFSMSDYEPSADEEDKEPEDMSDEWSGSSIMDEDEVVRSRSKLSKPSSFPKVLSKTLSKFLKSGMIKSGVMKSYSGKVPSKSKTFTDSTADKTATTDDDLDVHPESRARNTRKRAQNPHFDMLYCNESETDMIKWASKYKQKTFEISASDEFSKKAELLTKQIALEFYEWWVGLGNVEFKSEIKRPEDIEELFQVWFDEHASRGLKLDPKTLPCVLRSIADFVGLPKAACPMLLKRQIACDIDAETSPAHTMAFGTCLPIKMKHIPPQNSTKELWHCVKIPEDLRTMTAVWEDIQHLTSSKAFQYYLEQRPRLPMPPCFKKAPTATGDKKQLFVVPSDFVMRARSMEELTTEDLSIPISQFSLELKEVLSRLLND